MEKLKVKWEHLKLIIDFMTVPEGQKGKDGSIYKYDIWETPNGNLRDVTSVPANEALDYISALFYANSWYALMPVVKKLYLATAKEDKAGKHLWQSDSYNNLQQELVLGDINTSFLQVVECIKLYNFHKDMYDITNRFVGAVVDEYNSNDHTAIEEMLELLCNIPKAKQIILNYLG